MKTKEKADISTQEQVILLPEIEEEQAELEQKKSTRFPKQWKIALIIMGAIIFIATAVFVGLLAGKQNKSGQVTTISTSSLKQVIEISELSTVDYTYNSIAVKRDWKNNVMYHVAYEGIVTAGIDFNAIEIELLETEKKVIITIPPVSIHSMQVNMGTMEYIFTKSKYETEEISGEAYKLCKEDLQEKIKNESALHDTARENAISTVQALFKPWVESLDRSYTVEVH